MGHWLWIIDLSKLRLLWRKENLKKTLISIWSEKNNNMRGQRERERWMEKVTKEDEWQLNKQTEERKRKKEVSKKDRKKEKERKKVSMKERSFEER